LSVASVDEKKQKGVRRASGFPSISLFVFGSYLISWAIWIFARRFHNTLHIEIAPLTLDVPVQAVVVLFGNVGPGLSASLIVGFSQGWAGVQDLWGGLRVRRLNWPWLVFVCLLMPFLCSIALLAYWLWGGQIAATGNPARWLLLIAVNLPFAPLWEEIGWRGFLLRGLEVRHNGLIASAFVAGVWAPWHLALYWGRSVEFLFWFLVCVCALAFIFTWVYNRSEGSLIPVVLLHVMANTTNIYLLWPTMRLFGMRPFLFFVGSVSCAALLVAFVAGPSLGKNSIVEPAPVVSERPPTSN
jgi:membrane protease YdiL (CAAX protease family)